MSDEKKLRQVYDVVLGCWKMFKKHSGTDCTDAKWDAIVSEAGAISEACGQDEVAKRIIFGFVDALELEDKMKRGN